MTGHEFAQAHGNDSSDWTAADFESEMVLADIDMQALRNRLKEKPAKTLSAPAGFQPAA